MGYERIQSTGLQDLAGEKVVPFWAQELGYSKMPPTLHGDTREVAIRVRTEEEACRFVEKNS